MELEVDMGEERVEVVVTKGREVVDSDLIEAAANDDSLCVGALPLVNGGGPEEWPCELKCKNPEWDEDCKLEEDVVVTVTSGALVLLDSVLVDDPLLVDNWDVKEGDEEGDDDDEAAAESHRRLVPSETKGEQTHR